MAHMAVGMLGHSLVMDLETDFWLDILAKAIAAGVYMHRNDLRHAEHSYSPYLPSWTTPLGVFFDWACRAFCSVEEWSFVRARDRNSIDAALQWWARTLVLNNVDLMMYGAVEREVLDFTKLYLDWSEREFGFSELQRDWLCNVSSLRYGPHPQDWTFAYCDTVLPGDFWRNIERPMPVQALVEQLLMTKQEVEASQYMAMPGPWRPETNEAHGVGTLFEQLVSLDADEYLQSVLIVQTWSQTDVYNAFGLGFFHLAEEVVGEDDVYFSAPKDDLDSDSDSDSSMETV
ncbi:hypothetical protein LTR85_000352 [Meristemomyces frigidus]|nr:hypothetical protein LTR85_000352 [Meristemomyces frigidus]